MNKIMILLIPIFLSACSTETAPEPVQVVQLGAFEIEIPGDWTFEMNKESDLITGIIKSEAINLSFESSEKGYANTLIPTKSEYLTKHRGDWMPNWPYEKKGRTYLNIDSVKTHPFPMEVVTHKGDQTTVEQHYADTSILIQINYPEEIANHDIQIDTVDHYERKIIQRHGNAKGIYGIYMEDLNSDFNLNVQGRNIDNKNRSIILKAFESIKILR